MTGNQRKPPPPTGFAALAALRDQLPPGPAATPAAPTSAPSTGPVKIAGPVRAVARLERKGRGGKEATIVEKLALKPRELEQWCKELKQALGCGGVVEGDTIVLQGDLRQRIGAVLTARGVTKVTIAN